jgi:hypothetical protein
LTYEQPAERPRFVLAASVPIRRERRRYREVPIPANQAVATCATS